MYKSDYYAGQERMCDLIDRNYHLLQVIARFGISPGFGDKTVAEVCADYRVDVTTFLAVVQRIFDPGAELKIEQISVRTLTDYLRNAHRYFLDFRLPAIRRKLIESVNCTQHDVAFAIMRYYDEYVAEVIKHLNYEEQTVFPYVEALLSGSRQSDYSIAVFRSQHDRIEEQLRELKNIIIKYYPSGTSNELNDVLYDIYTCEQELRSHNDIENDLFVPAVERLASEQPTPESEPQQELSMREKEIIVCVVKGLTNKEIAEELCISTHTVITHRRNIASKLQIHSTAGLTIYAIVNNLVELSEIQQTINGN